MTVKHPVRHTIIIGAGPSGLSALYYLKKAGIHDILLVDKNERIGGTWASHTYPGLHCDIPSELYSLGFAPNPRWSSVFASQPEIQQYLETTAHQNGLTPHIQLKTDMMSAIWLPSKACWKVTLQHAHDKKVQEKKTESMFTRFLVVATGYVGAPKLPDISGLKSFKGDYFHSAHWNHQLDLTNKCIAVIGSGASAIQLLPKIQPLAKQIYSFQRTPTWVLPKPDVSIPKSLKQFFVTYPVLHRQIRRLAFAIIEPLIPLLKSKQVSHRFHHTLGKWHIARGVKKKSLTHALTPKHPYGCKRPLLSNDWYRALGRNNVSVQCQAVKAITERHIIGLDNTAYPVDTIIFATGYDAKKHVICERIVGKNNISLQQAWSTEAACYHGMSVSGFPNLFMLLGPYSQSLVTSVMKTAEQQAQYIADAILHVDKKAAWLEVKASAQKRYVQNIAARTTEPKAKVNYKKSDSHDAACHDYYFKRQRNYRIVWPHKFSVKRFSMMRFEIADYDVG